MNIMLEYPKCSTCIKAKKWVLDHGYQVDFRDIVSDNPTADELSKWVKESGLESKRFFNTSGILYREKNLKEKLETMSEQEKYEVLASDGMLVKRPLLVTEKGIFPGFKEDEWNRLLSK